MADDKQTDKAIKAVRNNVATREQEEIARRAAQQSGSRGNAARGAFQDK